MAILVFKLILIPVLVLAGFFGLKAVVGLFDEPSEEEIQQWEANTELMEKKPGAETVLPVEAAENSSIRQALLEERLVRWKTAERHVRAARALEQRAIDEAAIVRLKQALQFAPDSREAQHLLLELYMRSENYADVVPLCVRLLDQDSTQWDVKTSLLLALEHEEKLELCVLLSEEMLLQQPDDVRVLEIAAYAQVATGNSEKALDFYKQILKADPENLLALEGAGYTHQLRSEWLQAAPYYLKLLDLNPKSQHYLALARSYAQLGEAGKTILLLGQARSAYGLAVITPWVSEPGFDPVRETPDFRSFWDRIVGERQRAKIEEIRRREIPQDIPRETLQEALQAEEDINLPQPADMQILKPRQHQPR